MAVRSVKDKKEKEEKQALKKIITEFLIQLLFTLIRYGTQVAFIIEALEFEGKLRASIGSKEPYKALNMTQKVYYCVPQTWKADDISQSTAYYRGIVYTFLFFLLGSSIVAIIHIMLWIILLIQLIRQQDYEMKTLKLASTVRTKFGFIENIVHDMPLTAFATEIFLARAGPKGLTCLFCASNSLCVEDKFVKQIVTTASGVLAISLCVIALTTAWRGLTVFFRWSYTKECTLVTVRGCVSIFVGLIYTMMILTPAFVVLNYRYSAVTGLTGTAISEIVGKLLIMGLLAWSVVILGACCCPLIRAIGN